MEVNLIPKNYIEDLEKKIITPFHYLKVVNNCLSSPVLNVQGRELLIRALAQISLFESHRKILQKLIRKAGLYPYLKKYFLDLTNEEELILSLCSSDYDKNFILHSMQIKIINLLHTGKNVVLSAPTSMGKSAIVDSLLASEKFYKVVIVVPTIALIDETRRRIQDKFSKSYQVIHHGSQVQKKKKVVFVLTQERVNERVDLKRVDLFVLDEFYKLAFNNEEKSRVIALNIALSKLLTVSKQFYLIGPYIDALRGLDKVQRDYVFVPSDFNTVATNVFEYKIKANDITSKNKALKKIINSSSGQTVIYCKSDTSIAQVANYLIEASNEKGFDRKVSTSQLIDFYQWLSKYYGGDWLCTVAISNGIAIHHGALPRAIQQRNISLFNEKKIKFLLCTSTLIEGINTAAENVVIFDNRNGNFSVDKFTHKNIAGRAGRMNQYLVGNVHCLEALPSNDQLPQVVDLPLGLQNQDSPINLLAGIQAEHLTEYSNSTLSSYFSTKDIPIEIIKNHSSYNVEIIEAAYNLVMEMSISDIAQMANIKMPKNPHQYLIAKFVKVVEGNRLNRLKIGYVDNDDLKNRIGWYIYSTNHSSYIEDRLQYIYTNISDPQLRSEFTDKELKIVKSIFKYAVPKALLLMEDLFNYRFGLMKMEAKADLGFLIHLFENNHLSASFSALEEMGVPIETLEKIETAKLREKDIDVLIRFLRLNLKNVEVLNKIDKLFIQQAIY